MKKKIIFTTLIVGLFALIFIGCNSNATHGHSDECGNCDKHHQMMSNMHNGGMNENMHQESMNKNMTDKGVVQNYSSKELKVGDVTTCPVMGTKFTVKENSKSVTINDKKYFVCCPACVSKLTKTPDKYLK